MALPRVAREWYAYRISSAMYFVYIIECADRSLYTGITTDVARRFEEHKSGTASHYTHARRAVRVVYSESQPTRSAALKREAAIKRLTRAQKEQMIRSQYV